MECHNGLPKILSCNVNCIIAIFSAWKARFWPYEALSSSSPPRRFDFCQSVQAATQRRLRLSHQWHVYVNFHLHIKLTWTYLCISFSNCLPTWMFILLSVSGSFAMSFNLPIVFKSKRVVSLKPISLSHVRGLELRLVFYWGFSEVQKLSLFLTDTKWNWICLNMLHMISLCRTQ